MARLNYSVIEMRIESLEVNVKTLEEKIDKVIEALLGNGKAGINTKIDRNSRDIELLTEDLDKIKKILCDNTDGLSVSVDRLKQSNVFKTKVLIFLTTATVAALANTIVSKLCF